MKTVTWQGELLSSEKRVFILGTSKGKRHRLRRRVRREKGLYLAKRSLVSALPVYAFSTFCFVACLSSTVCLRPLLFCCSSQLYFLLSLCFSSSSSLRFRLFCSLWRGHPMSLHMRFYLCPLCLCQCRCSRFASLCFGAVSSALDAFDSDCMSLRMSLSVVMA
jgi:hypothetical protein